MTGRQEAFIDAYINDIHRNQTAAAIAAGYSPKTAAQTASRLMKDEEVREKIKERQKEIHERNTATADKVMEFLTSVMYGEKVDNWVLRTVLGAEELTEGKPSARDRLKAAELLGKHYELFNGKTKGDFDEDSVGVVMMPDILPDEE